MNIYNYLGEYVNSSFNCENLNCEVNCAACVVSNICTSCSSGYLQYKTDTVICIAICKSEELFLNKDEDTCVTSCYDGKNTKFMLNVLIR